MRRGQGLRAFRGSAPLRRACSRGLGRPRSMWSPSLPRLGPIAADGCGFERHGLRRSPSLPRLGPIAAGCGDFAAGGASLGLRAFRGSAPLRPSSRGSHRHNPGQVSEPSEARPHCGAEYRPKVGGTTRRVSEPSEARPHCGQSTLCPPSAARTCVSEPSEARPHCGPPTFPQRMMRSLCLRAFRGSAPLRLGVSRRAPGSGLACCLRAFRGSAPLRQAEFGGVNVLAFEQSPSLPRLGPIAAALVVTTESWTWKLSPSLPRLGPIAAEAARAGWPTPHRLRAFRGSAPLRQGSIRTAERVGGPASPSLPRLGPIAATWI